MQNKLAKNKLTMSGFLFFIAAFLLAPLAYSADQAVADAMKGPPDATIDFDTAQFTNIFGKGRTGMGHVNMGGNSYPFTARVKFSGPLPTGNLVGEGKVWRMKKVGDFLGTYKPTGSPGVFMNDRGAIVSVREKGTNQPPKGNATEFTITFVDEVKD